MRFIALLCILLICSYIYSQNYTRDFGIRGGTNSGLTYRQYVDNENAFEAIIGYKEQNLRLTVLKQYCRPAFYEITDNLDFTYGYGAHVALYYTNRYNIFNKTYVMQNWRFSPAFGLDGYLGLEYHFREFPFIIGIDVIPFFEFSTSRFFYIFLDDAAIFLKYKF
jgi:hypothetical protein